MTGGATRGGSGEGGHRAEIAATDWKGSRRWAIPSYQGTQVVPPGGQ